MTLLAARLLAVPSVGAGNAPPGVGGPLTTLLSWCAYIVSAIAVGGVLVTAAKMMVAHHTGRGSDSTSGLAYVLAGCVLVASASGLVGVLV